MKCSVVDAHAHLSEISAIDQTLENARRAGVNQIIAVGMDSASNAVTLDLAQRFGGLVWPALGWHPWSLDPAGLEQTLAQIDACLDRCAALGEVGLDYKAKARKKFQQEVFERLLSLAVKHGKPVIVHCRFSHQRAYKMVREAGVRRAVFHWYSGPADVLELILADGYYISVTPALAYSPPHRAAAARAPLERILVETDTPVAYQGRIAQPADVWLTIEHLSGIKKLGRQEIAAATARNARRFFGLPGAQEDEG